MALTAISNTEPQQLKSDTGVQQNDRQELAMLLSRGLADSYLLYLKTQNVHWNIVGPMFYGMHKLTETQYEDMAEAIDILAERIRAIGFTAPGSFKQFSELASIEEENGTPDAQQMIKQLMMDNELVAKQLRAAVTEAEKVKDVKTADLLTERIGQHEENAWMLRSLIS
ncbi:Dps family protein [Aliikangiella sp. IMCC44653]